MIAGLLLVGLAVLALAGRRRAMWRFHPAYQAKLVASGLLSGFVLVEAGLWLWATPTVLETIGRPDLAAACEEMLIGGVPGGHAGGILALISAVWIGSRAAAGFMRTRCVQDEYRVESSIADTRHCGTHDLVVLPSSQPFAYAVGGKPAQVVISQGVIDGLPASSVAAIIAHEVAHVRNRHHYYLLLASAVCTALGRLPFVRTGGDRLRLALERWADEEAAGMVPRGRDGVRLALVSMATAITSRPAVTAFGGADMIAARLRALGDVPPPSERLPRVAVLGAIAVLVAASSVAAGFATHGLVAALADLSQCCHP